MSYAHAILASTLTLAGLVATTARAQFKFYDNGPSVTDPGAGAGGADASALQSLLGLQSLSFGCQVDQNNRLADDFTIDSCEYWKLNSFEFLAYQTGATTGQSTFTSANIRIWQGEPGQAGSVIVFGDAVTNRLVSSNWSNIYRVTDLTLLVNTRPYFKNVCDLGGIVVKGPATYWIDWQADGTIFSGPFVGAVSFKGQSQKPGSNAVQFLGSTGTWSPVADTGTGKPAQDLPFRLNYELVSCYPDCDQSCSLNIDDFICYQTYFAIGDTWADCDESGSLDISDFICYQTFYALGC